MVLRCVEQVLMCCGGCICTAQSRKLKFSMQIYVTHTNIIFEHCHASVILDNVDVLYLEDGNLCRPLLKNKTETMFFLKNLF